MNPVEELLPSREGPSSSGATSRTLIARVKADDPAAWERLVVLYGPLVYRWCRHRDLPEQETADVFQNVFQALAQHIAGFRKEKEGDTFRGWLRRITDNKVRKLSASGDASPAAREEPKLRCGSRICRRNLTPGLSKTWEAWSRPVST